MINLFTKIRFVLLISVALGSASCVKENPPQPTRTVVVLGSSTAAGTGAIPIDSGWVGLMTTKLAMDKKPAKVYNLAEGGYTTYDILPTGTIPPVGRPAPDPLRNVTQALSYKPDLVIINLPTNDIANGYKDTEITANYKTVIAALNKASVQYMITGTQPRDFEDDYDSSRLKSVNDLMLSSYSGKVVDILAKLSTTSWRIAPAYALGDGIHLNNNGHKVISQSVTSHSIFKKVFAY